MAAASSDAGQPDHFFAGAAAGGASTLSSCCLSCAFVRLRNWTCTLRIGHDVSVWLLCEKYNTGIRRLRSLDQYRIQSQSEKSARVNILPRIASHGQEVLRGVGAGFGLYEISLQHGGPLFKEKGAQGGTISRKSHGKVSHLHRSGRLLTYPSVQCLAMFS